MRGRRGRLPSPLEAEQCRFNGRSKDGFTVAKKIEIEDKSENTGAQKAAPAVPPPGGGIDFLSLV